VNPRSLANCPSSVFCVWIETLSPLYSSSRLSLQYSAVILICCFNFAIFRPFQTTDPDGSQEHYIMMPAVRAIGGPGWTDNCPSANFLINQPVLFGALFLLFWSAVLFSVLNG
jgi:hypothetical protein